MRLSSDLDRKVQSSLPSPSANQIGKMASEEEENRDRRFRDPITEGSGFQVGNCAPFALTLFLLGLAFRCQQLTSQRSGRWVSAQAPRFPREVSVSQPSSSNIDAISSRVRGSSSATKAQRGIETLRAQDVLCYTKRDSRLSSQLDITYKRCSFLRAETVQSVCALCRSWTTNTDWHGLISRAGQPTPDAQHVQRASRRNCRLTALRLITVVDCVATGRDF
jgi:hypothetical protein